MVAFPLRPLRGHLPRKTGEARGGQHKLDPIVAP